MSLSDCPGLAIWAEHIHQSSRIKALDDDFNARWARAKATACEDGQRPCLLCRKPTTSDYELCKGCLHTRKGRAHVARVKGLEPVRERCPCGTDLKDGNRCGLCPECRRRRKNAQTHSAPKCAFCGLVLGSNPALCRHCRGYRGGTAKRVRRERS